MRRSFLALATAGLVTLPLVGAVPATAQEGDFAPFVTIDAAPAGAQVTVGEHFDGTEMDNTRRLADGAVGSLPVFFADDQYGCSYATAAASGRTDWIALARRNSPVPDGLVESPCALFGAKVNAAAAAGADALIVINHSPGHETGVAAGPIPMLMIDNAAGNRLKDSLNSANPDAVKVTVGLLNPETFLPPGTITPSKVSSLNAGSLAGGISVSGAASFGGEPPVTLAPDDAGDGPIHADTSRQTGVDLLGASVSQPDPANPTLVFEWKVTNLPPPSSLPEAIRYTIPFKITTPSGEKTYQLQAKLSNVASITLADDPPGHARAPGFFQLRGNCVANYQGAPVSNCPHIAWLNGSFNASTDTVRIELPLGQSYAPDIVPGIVLLPNVVAGGTIAASYQAVISNATTTDYAEWTEEVTYTVPSPAVSLGIAPAGTNPDNVNFSKAATVSSDGSFSGTLASPGPGSYEVFARACFGSNCGVKSVPITI